MGSTPRKMANEYDYSPMPDPLSVYVPLESLTESVVYSVISVATQKCSPNHDLSERTLLVFLLAINEKLKKIEDNTDATEEQSGEHIIQHAKQVREWLVDGDKQPLDWDELRKRYKNIADQKCDNLARYLGAQNADRYFELTMKTRFDDVKRSRTYMAKTRKAGYKPEELKLYWNVEQLENLCPKPEEESKKTTSHDPSDNDAIENLREFPVGERNHSGKITYKNTGIEKAVFEVPKDAQIIILNFANEQSPGGGYLRHAWAQEEIILYNSDGYRALLDLKYGRMGGGYAIPEFGLAYVRDICFYDSESEDRRRKADMLVSACYCMNGQELYDNPKNENEWKKNNLAKFRAFMSAAVANTIGSGENTYLLLGPIGTGAFGNDVKAIGEVFREVLKMPMMQSTKPIRYAFGNIWFVSTDKWKNDEFEDILHEDSPPNDENN